MEKRKGKKTSELVFKGEYVEPMVKMNLREANIYVQLAEKDDWVGSIAVSEDVAQRTRFGAIRAIGPYVNYDEKGNELPENEQLHVGDIVAVQFHVGSWLNAPAFGFRDNCHLICTSHNVMFTLSDKTE